MYIDRSAAGKPLPHMWSKCGGAGRAAEGLRAEWQRQLRLAVHECGFEYIRFHGLLAEDMFVCSRQKDGRLRFHFAYIDTLFDALMEIGIRPIVEFDFMPPALASGTQTQFWWKGNVTPAADLNEWAELIETLVRHWQERYGVEETRRWYYEVWNEPDLHGFWSGTKSEYFEMYRYTVKAVKQVEPALRVGGPATSNFVPDGRYAGEREAVTKHITHQLDDLNSVAWQGVWIQDFLDFCAREKLPVDFVSTHPYPTDFALDGQQHMRGRSRYKDSTRDDMMWLRSVIAGSAYPNAQIHLTEWSSSPSSRDCSHDGLPAADYVVKCNLDCAGLADSLSYWVFTDIFEEVGGGPGVFHGGFGLVNLQGIRKPTYHAYRFLHALGHEELAREEQGIITRDEQGKIRMLFYNYPAEVPEAVPLYGYPAFDRVRALEKVGQERPVDVSIGGVPANALFVAERLRLQDTPLHLWHEMGCPDTLTRAQENALHQLSPTVETYHATAQGLLELHGTLAPWELLLVREA